MECNLPKDGLEINHRIMEMREALGLKQTELSEGIKMSQTYIGNIETGKRKVNDRLISLLVMTYGVNEEWLRTGNGNMFNKEIDPKTERILRNFKKLDGLLQDYVLKQIDLAVEYQEKKGHG
jgi:transcriptional regulator with XRE-family HTH domain